MYSPITYSAGVNQTPVPSYIAGVNISSLAKTPLRMKGGAAGSMAAAYQTLLGGGAAYGLGGGAGAGGGGGGGGDDFESAQRRANNANQARYNAAVGEASGARASARTLYNQATGELAKVGAAGMQDIERGATRALATGQQGLITSGLTNTTIGTNLPRAVEEDRRRAALGLEEMLAQQRSGLQERRAGVELAATGALTGLMASKVDQGPDAGLAAGLTSQAAEYGQAPSQVSIQEALRQIQQQESPAPDTRTVREATGHGPMPGSNYYGTDDITTTPQYREAYYRYQSYGWNNVDEATRRILQQGIDQAA